MVKKKKYQYKTKIYNQLLNWKESDPKQYWEVINKLKKGENIKNSFEINSFDCNERTEHFKSQGKLKNSMKN